MADGDGVTDVVDLSGNGKGVALNVYPDAPWVRRIDVLSMVSNFYANADDDGAGNGTNDVTAFSNAMAYADASSRPVAIELGDFQYRLDTPLPLVSGLRLMGEGATITGLRPGFTGTDISNTRMRGIKFIRTLSEPNSWFYNLFNHSDFIWEDLEFDKINNDGYYVGLMRGTSGSEGCFDGTINGFVARGCSAVWIEGHDITFGPGARILGKDGAGGDDSFKIAAQNCPSYNIQLIEPHVEWCTAILSIGSEIGVPLADDPTYSRFVRNVNLYNGEAINCARIAYIKPGGNTGNDVRNGLVEQCYISGYLEDLEGNFFHDLVMLEPGRGAIIRDLEFKVRGRVRAEQQSFANAGLNVYPRNLGTQEPLIDRIKYDISIVDANNGETNGVAGSTAPGHPLDFGINIDKQLAAFGIVGRVEGKLEVHGCRRNGVYTGPNIDGPIIVRNPVATNISNAADAGLFIGYFAGYSPIQIEGRANIQLHSAHAALAPFIGAGHPAKTIAFQHKRKIIQMAATAAGTGNYAFFGPDHDIQVLRVKIVVDTPPTQDNTNYAEFEVRNIAAGAVIAQINTTIATGAAIVANTAFPVTGADMLTVANSRILKDGMLRVGWKHGGAGRAVVPTTVIIDYVEYGE
jgi:hypothetical protein